MRCRCLPWTCGEKLKEVHPELPIATSFLGIVSLGPSRAFPHALLITVRSPFVHRTLDHTPPIPSQKLTIALCHDLPALRGHGWPLGQSREPDLGQSMLARPY